MALLANITNKREEISINAKMYPECEGYNINTGSNNSENDPISRSHQIRNRLIHRRFGYFGSEELRNLNEVTSDIKKKCIWKSLKLIR